MNIEFVNALMPAAIEASRRTGIDPRIIVAQAAQETGWGRHAPGNNYFGIKSHGQAGGQTFTTHEVIDGKRVKIRDSFRQYGSPEESVMGYADFMLRNPRYEPMRTAEGLDAQLEALGESGYATDPNYARSVGQIARSIPLPDGTSVASFDPAQFGATPLDAPDSTSQMAFAEQPDAAPQNGGQNAINAMLVNAAMPQARTDRPGYQIAQVSEPTPFDPAAAGAVEFDPSQFGAVPVEEGAPEEVAATEQGDIGGFFQSLDSFIRGAADVPTFGLADELAAGMGALTGIGGEFGDYSANLEAQRATDVEREQENPYATLAGQFAGALAAGVIAAPRIAATLGGRVAQGAALGAGSGAAYGFGSGEGVEDRTLRALQGGMIGGATGAAIPAVTSGVRALGRGTYNAVVPRVRAVTRPAQEAERRVGQAVAVDRAGGQALGQADEASAALNQQSLLNVDRGGETTRAMARSAANVNPEARGILEKTASDRFAGQGPRAQRFINRIMNDAVDDVTLRDEIKQAARKANAPAYRRAYEAGERAIWSPELERLSASPAMQKAMRGAVNVWQDVAIADGFGAMKPGALVEGGGQLRFLNGRVPVFPNLQFWDYTKRILDDRIGAAVRSGQDQKVRTLSTIKNALSKELDRVVPEYQRARGTAATFFGAEDALEAGRKFVTQSRTLPETRAALEKMRPEERTAFAVGFASEMKDMVSSVRDRSNVIDRIFGSAEAREKVRLALGPERFKAFEQFVRVENAMDKLRGALGNSTTARQLVELGLAGSAGAGAGFLTGDWQTGITTALLVRGARAMGSRVDENLAKRVADLLLSDDPKQLEKAVQMAAKNPSVAKAVRGMTDFLDKGLVVSGAENVPEMVMPRTPAPMGVPVQ